MSSFSAWTRGAVNRRKRFLTNTPVDHSSWHFSRRVHRPSGTILKFNNLRSNRPNGPRIPILAAACVRCAEEMVSRESKKSKRRVHQATKSPGRTRSRLPGRSSMSAMSRQVRYQLRHQRAGLCHECSRPAASGFLFCELHRRKRNLENREKQRKRFKRKIRYLKAESYRFTGSDAYERKSTHIFRSAMVRSRKVAAN